MTTGPKPRGFVAQAQLKAWEREYARLGKDAQKIERRRAQIKTLIDTARSLGPYQGEARALKRTAKRRANKPRKATHTTRRTAAISVKKPEEKAERSIWKPVIRKIAQEASRPVSYSEAREMILKTELGEKLLQSDKGFYHAITKLNKSGEIKAYRGYIFSIEAHQKYESDVAAGKTKPLKFSNPSHVSPMGDAISDLMKSRPNGIMSGNIRWELQKNQEFAETIKKNPTHLYNVLARMVRQDQLIKRGKRYFAPKTETPPDNAGGVSNLFGEGGTSPSKGRGAA